MHNPIDKTFFKFLFGFVSILLVSFGIFFVVDYYSSALDASVALILK